MDAIIHQTLQKELDNFRSQLEQDRQTELAHYREQLDNDRQIELAKFKEQLDQERKAFQEQIERDRQVYAQAFERSLAFIANKSDCVVERPDADDATVPTQRTKCVCRKLDFTYGRDKKLTFMQVGEEDENIWQFIDCNDAAIAGRQHLGATFRLVKRGAGRSLVPNDRRARKWCGKNRSQNNEFILLGHAKKSRKQKMAQNQGAHPWSSGLGLCWWIFYEVPV